MRSLVGQGLQALCTPLLGGIGAVLMLHRVVERRPGLRLANVDIETPPLYFTALLDYLMANEFEFVSIDQVHDRLANPRRQKRRFVALTFDDGYRDSLRGALTVCRARRIPLAIYVTTGFADRTVAPWWYAIEDACLTNERIAVEVNGNEHVRWTRTPQEKRSAYLELDDICRRLRPIRQAALLEQLVGRARVSAMTDELFYSWDELRALRGDDLVTIGAHTHTHPVLRHLTEGEAREEIAGSRQRIQTELQIPVKHFAFPFGSAADVGAREVRLAREAGFLTATTTHMGNVFGAHREHLHALPRIYDRDHDLTRLGWLLSGIRPTLRSRGQRVVSVAGSEIAALQTTPRSTARRLRLRRLS